jgi:integrase
MNINVKNDRLYLLGMFPAKDGSGKMKQQRVSLQMVDTERNRAKAKKLMQKAIADLNLGQWNWSDWSVQAPKPAVPGRDTPKKWAAAIRALYRKKVTLGRTSESTWKVNYMGTLKFMPMEDEVTPQALEQALSKYERDQYTYKKLYYLLRDIAQICRIEFPEVGVPLTKKSAMDPTDVPSDDEIIDWVMTAPAPYKWYFGMMATYGLRPHECDEARLLQNDDGIWLVQVDDQTKTGYRTVIPQQLEWVEMFDLRLKTERPESERNVDRNDGCSQWLNKMRIKMGIKWRPYALRHAYAGRLWRNGGSELEVFTAAAVMGHSQKEHTETYRRWIDPNKLATSALDAILRNQVKVRGQLEKSFNREDGSHVDA